jgi:hypothetical protein
MVKVEAELVKEASIHSKRSRTQTAIDREKLDRLRAKKSQHPKDIEVPTITKPEVII